MVLQAIEAVSVTESETNSPQPYLCDFFRDNKNEVRENEVCAKRIFAKKNPHLCYKYNIYSYTSVGYKGRY